MGIDEPFSLTPPGNFKKQIIPWKLVSRHPWKVKFCVKGPGKQLLMSASEVRTPWKPLKNPLENLKTEQKPRGKSRLRPPWKRLSIPLYGLKME